MIINDTIAYIFVSKFVKFFDDEVARISQLFVFQWWVSTNSFILFRRPFSSNAIDTRSIIGVSVVKMISTVSQSIGIFCQLILYLSIWSREKKFRPHSVADGLSLCLSEYFFVTFLADLRSLKYNDKIENDFKDHVLLPCVWYWLH